MEFTDGIISNISFLETDPVAKIKLGRFYNPRHYLLYLIKVDTVLYNYDSAKVPNDKIMETAFLLIDRSKNVNTDTIKCISVIKTNIPNVVMFGRVLPPEILKNKKIKFHAVIGMISIKSHKLHRIINKSISTPKRN